MPSCLAILLLQVVIPDSFKGPIRLRLARAASRHAASKPDPSSGPEVKAPTQLGQEAADAGSPVKQSARKAGPSSPEPQLRNGHQADSAEPAVEQTPGKAGPSVPDS
jgi:hypothetical protein